MSIFTSDQVYASFNQYVFIYNEQTITLPLSFIVLKI